MARPEDTLARGNARNGFGEGYDDQQDNTARRDPRRPFDQRGREEPPLRAANPGPQQAPRGQNPGLNPQFDPYVPQTAAQSPPRQPPPQGRPTAPLEPMRAPPRPADPRQVDQRQAGPQGHVVDPYGQNRGPRPAPATPLPADRYAQNAPGGSTAGRPGQTQRPPAPGFAPPPPAGYVPQQGQAPRVAAPSPRDTAAYDPVPPSRRGREPFFEAPPSSRQAPPPVRQPASSVPVGLAQDGYGDDRYGEVANTADAAFEDAETDGEDEGEYYEEEPAPRSRRGLMITAALAAAIALGGGAGYVYKISTGHARGDANPPVVSADAGPVKAIPVVSDQGGDPNKKTILERAGDNGAAPAVVPSQEQLALSGDQAASGDSLAGPRKVATVVVKPGQKIDAAPAPASDGQADMGVPGISLDGVDPASKPVSTPRPPPMPPAAAAAPAAPSGGGDTAAADQAAPAEPPVKLGKPMKKPKLAAVAPQADAGADTADESIPPDPTAAPAKVASTGTTHKTGSGYLIQVRSTKTQTEALAYYADLQQRYGDLLGGTQPDIQEADLGAKGKWYRLRIGPPGSGAAAKDLCTKLKASGLDACIVAPY